MYVAFSVLKELQESDPESYGPFENDEKIRDFLKIYDSSDIIYVIINDLFKSNYQYLLFRGIITNLVPVLR